MNKRAKLSEDSASGRIVFNRAELLSVPEAAKRLGVNEETIRRHLRSGKLQAEKLGQQWFVHIDDLTLFSERYDPRTGPLRSG